MVFYSYYCYNVNNNYHIYSSTKNICSYHQKCVYMTINYNCNYFSLFLSLFFSVLLEIFSCIFILVLHICAAGILRKMKGKVMYVNTRIIIESGRFSLACLEGRLMNKFLIWAEKAIASRKIASQENWYPIRSISPFSLSFSLSLSMRYAIERGA